MSKIDKIHIRGVKLCMSKISKMGSKAQNTYKHVFAHNFLNI